MKFDPAGQWKRSPQGIFPPLWRSRDFGKQKVGRRRRKRGRRGRDESNQQRSRPRGKTFARTWAPLLRLEEVALRSNLIKIPRIRSSQSGVSLFFYCACAISSLTVYLMYIVQYKVGQRGAAIPQCQGEVDGVQQHPQHPQVDPNQTPYFQTFF